MQVGREHKVRSREHVVYRMDRICGPGSVVGSATGCGLDSLGIELLMLGVSRKRT